jgi:hypothetical protein
MGNRNDLGVDSANSREKLYCTGKPLLGLTAGSLQSRVCPNQISSNVLTDHSKATTRDSGTVTHEYGKHYAAVTAV